MSAQKICPQCGTEYELDQRFCPKDGSTLKTQGGTAELLGSVIADRYHVLRKLGEGGMGTVYLAEHVKMGRKSAVKVMNPGTVHDADAISRFNREAANASRINHPNVAAVYDFGETSDGMIYLAMEFIEGPALTQVIKDAGSLTPARAAEITRQAAEALSVAHDMGIVHRDLKPDNIMIARNREGGDLVKVVDFGIAKAANNEAQKVTKTGLVVGTPEYMSPEQLAGDKLDGRSDIYSLALVAFAMMTGKLPFPGETAQESMIARLTDEPKRLNEMKPEIPWPAEVQAVMDKALQRDAPDRYQTASQFGRELFKAVEQMPQAAPDHGPTTVMRASLSHRTPSKAKTSIAEAPASGGSAKDIPATNVHKSTRSREVVSEKKGRGLVFAGIALAVLAGGGGATYFAMKGNAAKPDTSAVQLSSAQRGDSASAPVSAVINLPRELERIAPMTDDAESPDAAAKARDALSALAKLDSAAGSADDATFLQFRYLRAKALMTSGARAEGCDSLALIQGRLDKDPRYQRASSFLFSQVCK